jgi:hypothetical protein
MGNGSGRAKNLLGTMNEEMCAMREEMCAMTKQLGQLKELGEVHKKSAAHKKPAAKNEGPTYRPKLDFVSRQMETLQKILESNRLYGPPPYSLSTVDDGELALEIFANTILTEKTI